MNRIALTGLIEIEFPSHTLRLCDGGFIDWNGNRYTATDTTFGQIGGMQEISEGVSEEVPVYELTLLPPSDTPASALAAPGSQAASTRLWLAEYDVDTGLVTFVGEPEFSGQVDQITLAFGPGVRTMGVSVVSNTARLLERNIGNSLNSAFQKWVWDDDTGHDNADNIIRQIAWGVEPGR